MYRTVLAATLTSMLVAVGFAVLVSTADAGQPPPPPPPPKEGICHNIGGPRGLGANCDMASVPCPVTAEDGRTFTLAPGQFYGIIVPFNTLQGGALEAHIAHGDGPIVLTIDPPLHLASTEGPHRASNVECIGTRILPQPPEPGN